MSMRHLAGAAGAPGGCYDADVVILSLDRPDETEAAIRSALAQIGVSRHVFIVDQGSRPEILARLVSVVAHRKDATLVALGRNWGVAGGRNRGTVLGHGRIIVGLDNDAEFADEHTLARAVAAVDADPMIAAIGCRIVLYASGADDLSSWGYPTSLLERAERPVFIAGRGAHAAATTRGYSFVGRNLTFACGPSHWAGASGIAATSRSAIRSVRGSDSRGPERAGSISYATGSTSHGSGVVPGHRWRRASSDTC